MAGTTTPRSLAEQLRGWSDADLARLLTARPDLATPAPQDSSHLASRAGTRASALRAVDQLTILELAVVDALVGAGGPLSLKALQGCLNADPSNVAGAVDRLLEVALVWGTRDELRSLSVLAEIVGTTVSRLGPPTQQLASAYGQPDEGDTGDVNVRLGELDTQTRRVLDRLDAEGSEGVVDAANRRVTKETAKSPVDHLLARGLLVARDRRHVVVPREVGLALRGGTTTTGPVDRPPELATADRDLELVDRTAAGAAFEFVRRVELLLEHWGTSPPPTLRGGGLGVRDLRAAAELLHGDEAGAALHVEVAHAAGLLAVGDTEEHDAVWLPTDAFDIWNAGTTADRWVRIALAWLDNPRLSGLVGGRDENNRPINALVPGLERAWLLDTRRTALEQLLTVPPGQVLAAGTGTPSLVNRVKWLQPRRPTTRARAVAWVVDESAVLGITALGGISAFGREVVDADDPMHAAPAALEPLLPRPVDHVLLQADLTAVAPGPLDQDLARQLASVADIESRGGATVYRFTPTSIRRAFDSGWSAGEVHDFVASASRTPVPQPLVYLVDDVSRRFGTVRVGTAEAFLRSDDESALTELMHNPRADSLRLRRIAPTVVVSDTPLDVLLPRLRELGVAPVVEAPDGTVRLARRDVHRARTPRVRPGPFEVLGQPTARDAKATARLSARVSATVKAIRSGDAAASVRPATSSARANRVVHTDVLSVLRQSVETKGTVWIRYVDNHGSTNERMVDPVRVEGGSLSAYDHRSDEVRIFAVHRIAAVAPADADS